MLLFLNRTEVDLTATAEENESGPDPLLDTIEAIRRYLVVSQIQAEGVFRRYLTQNRTAGPLRQLVLQKLSSKADDGNSMFESSDRRELFSAFNRINRGLYGDHNFRWPTAREMVLAESEAKRQGALQLRVEPHEGAPGDGATSWAMPGFYVQVL